MSFHSVPAGTVLTIINRQYETVRVEVVGPVEDAIYGDREVRLLECPELDLSQPHVMYIANPSQAPFPGSRDMIGIGTHVHFKRKPDKTIGAWCIVKSLAVTMPA